MVHLVTLAVVVSRQNVVNSQNESLGAKLDSDFFNEILALMVSLGHLLGWMVSVFSCREALVLENLALRRPGLALEAQRPCRRWTGLHKRSWVALRIVRTTAIRSQVENKIQSFPRLSGLHHSYAVAT